MIEFKVEVGGTEDAEYKMEKDVFYPKLHVSGVKEDDGIPLDEEIEVIAKIRKLEHSVSKRDGEKCYNFCYEVMGFSSKKSKVTDFGEELEKLVKE